MNPAKAWAFAAWHAQAPLDSVALGIGVNPSTLRTWLDQADLRRYRVAA